jgi:XTP/dITP diphosphohydrolase
MRTSPTFVFASTNLNKFIEMRSLLAKYPGIELVSPVGRIRNADKIGAVEVHSTYLENAAAKARLVNLACHFPALADDSGLEVMALEGRPGPRSARYAEKGETNTEKLLRELKGKTEREARFVCSLALVIEGTLITETGYLEGTISESPRGSMGFGYDPVFIPKGESRTLAEMTETEKNAISHRAVALGLLMKKVSDLGIQLAKT